MQHGSKGWEEILNERKERQKKKWKKIRYEHMGEGKEENEIMKYTTQEANEAGGKG